MAESIKVVNDIINILQELSQVNFIIENDKAEITEDDIIKISWDTKKGLRRYIDLLYLNGNVDALRKIKYKLEELVELTVSMIDVGFITQYNGKEIKLEPEQVNVLYRCQLDVMNETINTIDELLINEPNGLNIDFDVTKEVKICLLKELGVIDCLLQNGFSSNHKIAQFIEFLTKEPIKTGAVDVTLGRIQNEKFINEKQDELAVLKLKFSIKK